MDERAQRVEDIDNKTIEKQAVVPVAIDEEEVGCVEDEAAVREREVEHPEASGDHAQRELQNLRGELLASAEDPKPGVRARRRERRFAECYI